LALIEVSGLSFAYGERKVLDDVGFTVSPGERLAILGGNGSGKSTLAYWLAGWLPRAGAASSKAVLFDGRPWSALPLAERAGAVQLVGQIPAQHLSGRAFTVREEIAFGPENLGLPVSEIETRIAYALAVCRLEPLADRNPFTLSGGEQQRLVIAAALALKPAFLILDEPFTNLDPESRDHVISVLADLPDTVALVLFDTSPANALRLARTFAFLHEGRIAASGSMPDVLLHSDCVATIGLPPVTRAYLELAGGGVAGVIDLPLTLEDAVNLLKAGHTC
jgi:energy-coupling factor transport system ATP-binding protein